MPWKKCSTCGKDHFARPLQLRVGQGKYCSWACRPATRTTHGMSNTRLHRIWHGIKRRCYDPSFKSYNNYGGRGIKVCRAWVDDFMSFYKWSINSGYEDQLEIDRKDNNKGYSPKNCRWTTRTNNNLNRRKSKGFSSKYIGVCWIVKNKKWKASITVAKKDYIIGYYSNEIEAAKARDSYCKEHFPNIATLNFPNDNHIL